MNNVHDLLLELSVIVPLLGALAVSLLREPHQARRWALVFSGASLLMTVLDWQALGWFRTLDEMAHSHTLFPMLPARIFVMDELSAPLVPLAALIFFFTSLLTLKTKLRRFSFAWSLVSQSLTVATLTCQDPTCLIALLIAGTLPPMFEIRARARPTGAFIAHMAAFAALLMLGQLLVWSFGTNAWWTLIPFMGAVLIRSGIAPFHAWVPDLFEQATFGTALLFVVPMLGEYAALRLLLPSGTDSTWVLHGMGLLSMLTALYAAGMAIVQTEARRFFAWFYLSHSALVLVGLEMISPRGLTGALCVWLSGSLALTGFGLTLRAMESRRGPVTFDQFQGLYDHTPRLALFYALTGLACVGFPGTLGFIGTEILVDGAVIAYPYVCLVLVLAAAINGIAIVHTYFRLFAGVRPVSTVSLTIQTREQVAVLSLAAIILLGGLLPQLNIRSRYRAAEQLLSSRAEPARPIVRRTPRSSGTATAPSADVEALLEASPVTTRAH